MQVMMPAGGQGCSAEGAHCPAVLPTLGQVSTTLLRQADSGPLPLPPAALGRGAPQTPGETEEGVTASGSHNHLLPTNNMTVPA